MTVVATLMGEGLPILLGDLLVSRETEESTSFHLPVGGDVSMPDTGYSIARQRVGDRVFLDRDKIGLSH